MCASFCWFIIELIDQPWWVWSGLGPFHWPTWPNDKDRVAEDAEGWAPFNGPKGKALLGDLDLAFLGAYAVGLFFAGGSFALESVHEPGESLCMLASHCSQPVLCVLSK